MRRPLGADLLEPLQSRQLLNGFSNLLLRDAQLIKTLQVEPEFGSRPEEVRKTQGRISSNGTTSIQYLGYAVSRNIELPCKFRRTLIWSKKDERDSQGQN